MVRVEKLHVGCMTQGRDIDVRDVDVGQVSATARERQGETAFTSEMIRELCDAPILATPAVASQNLF